VNPFDLSFQANKFGGLKVWAVKIRSVHFISILKPVLNNTNRLILSSDKKKFNQVSTNTVYHHQWKAIK